MAATDAQDTENTPESRGHDMKSPPAVLAVDLAVVIVSYNTRDLLRKCLLAIPEAVKGLSVEVWVVDNNSPDKSAQMVAEEFPEVRLIANRDNPGFARANNQAIGQCITRHIVLLNPDTEAEPGSLACMVAYLDTHSDVGAIGPKLLNTDGSLQRNGRPLPNAWREFLGHSGLRRLRPGKYDDIYVYGRADFDVVWEGGQVSGACIMLPCRVIEQVGALDEEFFMFFEETEWCWRIHKAGYKVVYLPQARVVHHWMGSVRQQPRVMTARLYKSALIYYRKTGSLGERVAIFGVVGLGLAKNELLHLGVAVKRQLRARKLIK
jgi:N-acetylglucosaminyl-diphospho-decaprenol L-rhamnosyltransferase